MRFRPSRPGPPSYVRRAPPYRCSSRLLHPEGSGGLFRFRHARSHASLTITPEPQKGNPMSDSKRVVIFDTTLRDGEQSPGISLDQGEKLEIAEQLARLGRRRHRGRLPDRQPGRLRGRRRPSPSAVRGPVICGLSRTALGDVDRCWEAIEPAERRRIHVFIATSETHMKHKLRMTPDQVKAEAAAAVAHAKRLHRRRRVLARRTRPAPTSTSCARCCRSPVDNGATTLNIPDTVGYGIPEEYAQRLHDVRARGQRRLRHLHPLPRRPGPGRGQLAGRGARRCPSGRVHHQRHRASAPATPRWRRS